MSAAQYSTLLPVQSAVREIDETGWQGLTLPMVRRLWTAILDSEFPTDDGYLLLCLEEIQTIMLTTVWRRIMYRLLAVGASEGPLLVVLCKTAAPDADNEFNLMENGSNWPGISHPVSDVFQCASGVNRRLYGVIAIGNYLRFYEVDRQDRLVPFAMPETNVSENRTLHVINDEDVVREHLAYFRGNQDLTSW